MLVAEVEKEYEPEIEKATTLMEGRRKRCTATKNLVYDAKVGLALLLHLTLGDSVEKMLGDSEVSAALDRVERHLVSCLGVINHQRAPPPPGPRARAAEAAAAAERDAASPTGVVRAPSAAGAAEGDRFAVLVDGPKGELVEFRIKSRKCLEITNTIAKVP